MRLIGVLLVAIFYGAIGLTALNNEQPGRADAYLKQANDFLAKQEVPLRFLDAATYQHYLQLGALGAPLVLFAGLYLTARSRRLVQVQLRSTIKERDGFNRKLNETCEDRDTLATERDNLLGYQAKANGLGIEKNNLEKIVRDEKQARAGLEQQLATLGNAQVLEERLKVAQAAEEKAKMDLKAAQGELATVRENLGKVNVDRTTLTAKNAEGAQIAKDLTGERDRLRLRLEESDKEKIGALKRSLDLADSNLKLQLKVAELEGKQGASGLPNAEQARELRNQLLEAQVRATKAEALNSVAIKPEDYRKAHEQAASLSAENGQLKERLVMADKTRGEVTQVLALVSQHLTNLEKMAATVNQAGDSISGINGWTKQFFDSLSDMNAHLNDLRVAAEMVATNQEQLTDRLSMKKGLERVLREISRVRQNGYYRRPRGSRGRGRSKQESAPTV